MSNEWRPYDPKGDELQREGRAILNAWAQRNGYEDWEAAFRAGRRWSEVIREFQFRRMPVGGGDEHALDPHYPAGSLGVSASEHDK